MPRRLTIFCDGLTEPVNPGGYGCCAYIVFEGDVSGEKGAARPEPIAQKYGCIGHGQEITNNIVEYRAAIGALKWALKHAPDAEIELRTDSQLVERQISGCYKCHNEKLMPLLAEARELLAQLPNLKIVWVRREFNDVADALTKLAYIEARSVVR
jgi:ribonuclease HI